MSDHKEKDKKKKRKAITSITDYYEQLKSRCGTFGTVYEWYGYVRQLQDLVNQFASVVSTSNLQKPFEDALNLTDTTMNGIQQACNILSMDMKSFIEEYISSIEPEPPEPNGTSKFTITAKTAAAIGGGGASVIAIAIFAIIFLSFDFAIFVENSQSSITAGDSLQVPVQITLKNGDPETVNLSCSVNTPDVSCLLDTQTVFPTPSQTINAIITSSPTTNAGFHSVTITGSGGGKSYSSFINFNVIQISQLNLVSIEPQDNSKVTLPLTLKVFVHSNPPIKDANVDFIVDGAFRGSKISDSSGESFLKISQLSVGSHSWYAKAQKKNYQDGMLPLSHFIVDDVGNPTINFQNPTNNAQLKQREVEISGSALDFEGNIQRVEVRVNDDVFQIAEGTSQWSITVILLEGDNTITAKAFDNSGNFDEKSIIVNLKTEPSTPPDTIPPEAPQLLTPSGIINYNKPIFDWKDVQDPSGVIYNLMMTKEGKLVINAKDLPSSTYNPGISYVDGTYTWFVTAIDGAGNPNLANSMELIIDTVPPSAPEPLTPSGIITYNNPHFEWKGVTDSSGVTYRFILWRTSDSQYLFNVTSTTTIFDPGLNFGDDKYVWYVTAIDGAGNESTVNSMKFIIQTPPPIL